MAGEPVSSQNVYYDNRTARKPGSTQIAVGGTAAGAGAVVAARSLGYPKRAERARKITAKVNDEAIAARSRAAQEYQSALARSSRSPVSAMRNHRALKDAKRKLSAVSDYADRREAAFTSAAKRARNAKTIRATNLRNGGALAAGGLGLAALGAYRRRTS